MRSQGVGQPGVMVPPVGCEVPNRPDDAPAPGTPLVSHFQSCMGCGRDHPNGLRMRVVAGDGLTVHGRFAVTDHHQGAPGLAHGGLIALAMDEVLGGLGWLLRTPMVTGRLQVDFVRPVPVATELVLRAQVDGVEGRRIFSHAIAHAGSSDGPVLARAFAVFVQVPMEHFRTHGRAQAVDEAVRLAAAGGPDTPWALNP